MGFNLRLDDPHLPSDRGAPLWRRALAIAALLVIGLGIVVIADSMLAGGRYSSLLIADAGATLHQTGDMLRGLLGR
jgi:hypothetical protein